MKKTLSILAIFVLILITQRAESKLVISKYPAETIVLKLPNSTYTDWKEAGRNVIEEEGLIKWIPCNQTNKNWSELFYISFEPLGDKKNTDDLVDKAIHVICDRTFSLAPSNLVTWQIIEKNQNDFLFEWILHKQWKDTLPQHEICRVFLTETGFHCIGYINKNSEMCSDKREEQIKLLKDSASVVSIEEAANFNGLSMIEKLRDSLDLGSIFNEWQVESIFPMNNGATVQCRIPASQTETYITECLEMTTLPGPSLCCHSIKDYFEREKTIAQKISIPK